MKRPIRSPRVIPILALFVLILCLSPLGVAAQDQSAEKAKKAKKKEQEKPVKITEEIIVVGKLPKDIPLATVSTIVATQIDELKPLDLSDILKYVPGALVTFGNKDTFTLKLRGLDSSRILVLVDGVPVYEPYFGTCDLKTISAGGIDTVQVTKGPSSVLYGPNTLGGIVNVITRRPGDRPYLSLTGNYGDKNTKEVGLDGSARWDKFSLAASALYQDSDGFNIPNATDSGQTPRATSDYSRLNLNGKLYYTPSDSTEIMINGGLYQSNYGMPASLFTQMPRYWTFPTWDRSTLNAGGFTSLGGDAVLRFRAYYVNYYNTLDWYTDQTMTTLQSQSTYNNSVYGAFALAEVPTGERNTLKASFLFQRDVARIQDNPGEPWDDYSQGTVSGGLEDNFKLFDNWWIIGGLSLDVIHKFVTATNNTSLNPLIGLKFTPNDDLDFHVSFARKSIFPSMRDLYSTSGGNPDLLPESGTSLELTATYSRGIFLTGTVFFNRFRDFINSILLPDGTHEFYNVGRAHIYGFELQAQKSLSWFTATLNYTFLNPWDDSDNRPLDLQSKHNLNFNAAFLALDKLRLELDGIFGSVSWWYNTSTSSDLTIPAYFDLDAVISYRVRRPYEVFAKMGNVFNHYFYTEPGFPWRGRYFEVGFRATILD
jgi:iron complex outermembrane receptor protein